MCKRKYIYIFCFFVFFQVKFECALRHPAIKIVTPDWITDSVKGIVFAPKMQIMFHYRPQFVTGDDQWYSKASKFCDIHLSRRNVNKINHKIRNDIKDLHALVEIQRLAKVGCVPWTS